MKHNKAKPNRSAKNLYLQASFYLKKPHRQAWRGVALMQQLFEEFPGEKELVRRGREILIKYYDRTKK